MAGSAASELMMDSDAAGLVAQVEAHMQALAREAVELLGGAKDRMAALQAAALAAEQDVSTRKLEAKQAEVDLLGCELAATKGQLATTDGHLDRVSNAYFCKAQGIRNMPAQLRALYVWREYAARRRRLARLAARADAWYLQRWLLGRAYDRWAGQSRARYRLLVAARSQQQREADAAALREQHATEVARLRSGIAALEQQLQQEAAARSEMEEAMQRSFMRGVSAINLEALQIMRSRGPLAAAHTAAAGHQPQQHQQGGSSWSVAGPSASAVAAAVASSPAVPAGSPATATTAPAAGAEAASVAAAAGSHAAQQAAAAAPAAAGFGTLLSAWLPPAAAASAAVPAGQSPSAPWVTPFASLGIGQGMRHTPALLSPAPPPAQQQQQLQEAATSWGTLASAGATMLTGPQAGVFVERSAAATTAATTAAATAAAGKAAQQLQQQPSRALQAKRATGQARAF